MCWQCCMRCTYDVPNAAAASFSFDLRLNCFPLSLQGCEARTNAFPGEEGVRQRQDHRPRPQPCHQASCDGARPAGARPLPRGQGHDRPFQRRGRRGGGGGGRGGEGGDTKTNATQQHQRSPRPLCLPSLSGRDPDRFFFNAKVPIWTGNLRTSSGRSNYTSSRRWQKPRLHLPPRTCLLTPVETVKSRRTSLQVNASWQNQKAYVADTLRRLDVAKKEVTRMFVALTEGMLETGTMQQSIVDPCNKKHKLIGEVREGLRCKTLCVFFVVLRRGEMGTHFRAIARTKTL